MRVPWLGAGAMYGIVASIVLGGPSVIRTAPIDEKARQVLSSAFDDRSGPRMYRHDMGSPTTFLQASPGLELVGIHGFDAVGGTDILTSISCMWGDCTNGGVGRIYVWQADNTGDLNTAVSILDQAVTIRDAKTGRFCEYTLATPVTVKGRFYVGYSAVVNSYQSAYLVPTNTPSTPPGRAWLSGGFPGSSANYFASVAGPLDQLNYCLCLRASGASGAITYQGRLSDGGSPFTGPADMRFTFFDSPGGSTPLSPKFTNLGVPVTQSLFTTVLPGDANWFANAPDVYLEIEIRRGSDEYVTLSPRQRITRAPAALHAVRAAAADQADSAITAQFATTAESAATATAAENATLAQSVPWSGVTGVPANVANAFSPWINGGNGILSYAGGNVGIGTVTPNARLEVSGGPVGSGWLTRFTNPGVGNASFRTTGMRVSDDGFFEVSNSAALGAPNFARLAGNGAWTAVSDARLKTDVTPDDPAEMLAAALKLRPVHFVWKRSGERDAGLIAQDVRDVMPELVTGDESRGVLTVDYTKIGVIAVGAVQAQQAELRTLRERVAKSEAENAALKDRLERLESKLK
ncbi:MAG: tail fiber domain-containing protein [Phycisphaerales bacterium]